MHSRHHRFRIRHFLGVLFISSLIISLWSDRVFLTIGQVRVGEVAMAQSPDASSLVQQGVKLYQAGNYRGAIEPWQTALSLYQTTNNPTNEAIVLENLASAYQQLNQNEQAIRYWESAIASYRQIGDKQQVGRLLTEQAQAYINLGQLRQAIAMLCAEYGKQSCNSDSALQIAHTYQNRQIEAAALGSLGDAYRLKGEYEQAIDYLQASLKIAKEIDHPIYHSSTLNSLGNAYLSLALVNYRREEFANAGGNSIKADEFKQNALSYNTKALGYFQDSLELARVQDDQPSQMRTLLHLIPLHYRTKASPAASEALQQALSLLAQLPDSRDKVYAAIDLAHLLQPIALFDETSSQTRCLKPEQQSKAIELLQQAVSTAQRLEDRRSESFALGELGHLYECRQDYKQALDLTRQARLAADQDLLAKDSLYLWDWQAGRIFKAQGREKEAIDAYEGSVRTLRGIRGDITSASRDLQLDFRGAVEPIYRELTQLRLSRAMNPTTSSPQQELDLALKTIDELRLAELQDYLGNDCELSIAEKPVVQVDQNTAVFSSIILKERIAVILTLPSGDGKFKSKISLIPVETSEAIELINDFRQKLQSRFDRANSYKERAIQLYDWLIRPFASDLEQAHIKTLVFLQDGILRSIPMAALYDGKQFLIQNYAIASTPALALANPTPLDSKRFQVLAFGLTKESAIDNQTKFPPLSFVKSEIESILATIPGSEGLLDENFSRDRLEKELKQNTFPVLHVATHGQFGFDAEQTFLVTGKSVASNKQEPATLANYNERLTLNELYRIIKNTDKSNTRVKLLTLTACETAVGSDRDALGLAGIAFQAGAQSAVATLWQVDDEATAEIITPFYQALRSGLSKAEALQATQKAWLEAHPTGPYNHPGYWTPFILIGNWL